MKILFYVLMVIVSPLAYAEDSIKTDTVIMRVFEGNIESGVVVIDNVNTKVQDAKAMISKALAKNDKVKIIYSSNDKRDGGLHEWIKTIKSDKLTIEYGKMAQGGLQQ